MTGKWDALIAELEVKAVWYVQTGNGPAAELFNRAATALREAQAQLPPEGWRVTEYRQQHGATVFLAKDGYQWIAQSSVLNEIKTNGGAVWHFPTAAAAMAAIEEVK